MLPDICPCKNLPVIHHQSQKDLRPISLSRLTKVSGASEALGCDKCWPEWLRTLHSRVAETRPAESWWSTLVLSICGCTYHRICRAWQWREVGHTRDRRVDDGTVMESLRSAMAYCRGGECRHVTAMVNGD